MALDPERARTMVRLSRAQNSAIGTRQLIAAGLTRGAIRSRVRSGRLIPAFRGAYVTVDPELVPLARPAAALLALGPDALLSHRSAASVWGLAKADPETIELTVIGRRPRAREGIRLHLVQSLHSADVTTHQNLRLTSPARTLIDFAAQASSHELTDAFGDARAKRLLNDRALNSALARTPANHPGAAVIRSLLREGGTYDRSRAESLMRRLCRQSGLTEPQTNVMLHGHLADFVWAHQKLVVEVDGYGTHGNRRAFESDRRRDQIHAAAGYLVIRITWRQLQDEPLAVIARLAQALAHRSAA